MQKQKKWQSILMITVAILTLYNILPTLLFYTKPLHSQVRQEQAEKIAVSILSRINNLENQSISWINSFCSLLSIRPSLIKLDPENHEIVTITFKNSTDATLFKAYLPRAGSLIPFVPAQLSLYGDATDPSETLVKVLRKIPIHFPIKNASSFLQFAQKFETGGTPTPLYEALVKDRFAEIALAFGGPTQNAQMVQALCNATDQTLSVELATTLSRTVVEFTEAFGVKGSISKQYLSSFSQTDGVIRKDLIHAWIEKIESCSLFLSKQITQIEQEETSLKSSGEYLAVSSLEQKQTLSNKLSLLQKAKKIILENFSLFSEGVPVWSYPLIGAELKHSPYTLSLQNRNPFIDSISIHWATEEILIKLNPELTELRKQLATSNQRRLDDIDLFLFNEIASFSRATEETVSSSLQGYRIALSELPNSQSFLAFRLAHIAQAELQEIKQAIDHSWNPVHPDLKRENFPILDYSSYQNLPASQRKLCLVLYSPVTESKAPESGFKMNSIYVIAKGVDQIVKKLQEDPSSESAKLFMKEFYALRDLLHKSGYIGYDSSLLQNNKQFVNDFIFESPDYFQTVLAASREAFLVQGTKRYATLELSTVEQRILVDNKIDTLEHEDLLKWRDDYLSAQLSLKGASKFDVPKPTQSPFWSNFKLSFVKYFRGDDRKILRWGLDLSGGKTVQIELRDANGKLVTNPADLKQGINELYSRVNKMGVSEVSIRQEGNFITLDFPGSQNLSAAELVKASSMYFHVVNEKFSPNNSLLASSVEKFLQEIWNEAVVSNKKNIDDINLIAWKHLYGDGVDPDAIEPKTQAAKLLYDQGLRLANPLDPYASSTFNDVYSKLAIFRGSDYTQWQGQTHPLLIVFKNFAVDGSNLEEVQASYDPSRGNFLGFSIRNSNSKNQNNPRDDFEAWTTPFSKEKVTGTENGTYSHNLGWRMAVVLNGSIVSCPTLDSPLRDRAMITGSFSQRETNQLESDLKAGSLSFSPKILSEKNVSPELGAKEKTLGIWATVLALVLVIAVMTLYYRFGGMVASIAVIFNLLIMWATLQNMQATLTLSSLAGLILTVGMAVDANVLVFERIREEFALSGKIASAIYIGYKRAFSAILDSNITTLIAALILLRFDSGPIKGFAVTLIIGLISSMFTALFATKFFFTRWAQNPKHKMLLMMNLFKIKKLNFLKYALVSSLISAFLITVGASAFIKERHSLFGMDFTGGYALNLDLEPTQEQNYRALLERAFIQAGVKPQELQIRELSPSNNLRIFFSKSLNQSGRPFAFYPLTADKITWITSVLNNSNIKLASLDLEQNWTEVSGQMSETMRNGALVGLTIALICIFIYITLRFEFKYAMGATICLIHDILLTLAAIAILHLFGVPLQIDLNTIAALMTMIGYSLNDTIIVFDRIREDTKEMKRIPFKEIINHSLTVTLSRTILTSGTTLLVLIPLILMGGSTIFGFALVMGIGVVFGTLSSLLIAAPSMLFFHQKEKKKQQIIAINE